jgi:UDP:flavonoid glycosyltransferase YjiC (YdhE family)
MRILFAAAPGFGLILPMVTMMWAARAAGHEVLVATTAHMTTVAAQCGLLVVDVFPHRDVGEDLVAASAGKEISSDPPGTPAGYARLASEVRPFELFALAMLDGTISAGREFNADLVVYSPDHIAGKLAAQALEIPAIELGNRVSWSPRDPGFTELSRANPRMGVLDPNSNLVRDLRAKIGIGTSDPRILARIDPRPPSFGGLQQVVYDADGGGPPWMPMRYVPFNGGGCLPGWALSDPVRPRICLTLGTVAPLLPGGGGLSEFLTALSDLPVEVVLADSESDLSGISIPRNVRVGGYVPLNGILSNCALIIHHGGSGTTAAALGAAVPQLVVAQGSDNEICADRVVRSGVGMALPHVPGAARGNLVEAVNHILQNEKYSLRAREISAEIEAQPSPSVVLKNIISTY